jgi:transposase
MKTYYLSLTPSELARVLDALDLQARTMHDKVAEARAAGFDAIAQGLYADALQTEALAHWVARLDDVDAALAALEREVVQAHQANQADQSN